VRIAVISDTHLPRGSRRLPDACVDELRRADLILHGGDIATAAVLDEIERFGGGPVYAVRGNVDQPDLWTRIPETRVVEADGARIAMIHDAGQATGRLERLRARFPDVDAVVFGHSHIPLHEERDGFHIFNPGSPTDRRRQPQHTMGVIEVSRGTGLLVCRHLVVDPPP
jgi:putative phosphoesterase